MRGVLQHQHDDELAEAMSFAEDHPIGGARYTYVCALIVGIYVIHRYITYFHIDVCFYGVHLWDVF